MVMLSVLFHLMAGLILQAKEGCLKAAIHLLHLTSISVAHSFSLTKLNLKQERVC